MQQAQQDYGVNLYADGRIVWGDLKVTEQKDYMTKQTKLDKNGRPVMGISFGLAIPKVGPNSTEAEKQNFNRVWQAIASEGQKQGFQYPSKGFHWKVVDGDNDRKDDGSEYGKDYKGQMVLSIKQQFNDNFKIPPTIVKGVVQSDGSYTYLQISADEIKTGDYVRVNMNIKGHGAPNAGLYVNPNGIMFLQAGEPIASARPSAQQMFGNAAPAITFQQAAAPQGMPQFQQQAPMMQQQQQPVGNFGGMGQFGNQQNTAQQQSSAPIDPYYGAMPPQFQQQQQPAAAPQGMPQFPPPFGQQQG